MHTSHLVNISRQATTHRTGEVPKVRLNAGFILSITFSIPQPLPSLVSSESTKSTGISLKKKLQ